MELHVGDIINEGENLFSPTNSTYLLGTGTDLVFSNENYVTEFTTTNITKPTVVTIENQINASTTTGTSTQLTTLSQNNISITSNTETHSTTANTTLRLLLVMKIYHI